MAELARIRNFCVIAHVDHGKTTLSDRLLETTGTVPLREMRDQLLDSMELEREHGITIKARAVRMTWRDHELNLIDTPGHVDFTYEVSRSLAACEGAVLLVDASQGIEAQTLANAYLAVEQGLEVIPVINKIDLPNIDIDVIREELRTTLGFRDDEILLVSGKTGAGVTELLDAIVERVPPPVGNVDAPLRALIFDSHYDAYKGVVAHVRVVDGSLGDRDRIRLFATEKESELLELGVFVPDARPIARLETGETGYVATGLKAVADCRVGDTLTLASRPATAPLPGYRPAKPMVFAGFYPSNAQDYPLLKDAMEKHYRHLAQQSGWAPAAQRIRDLFALANLEDRIIATGVDSPAGPRVVLVARSLTGDGTYNQFATMPLGALGVTREVRPDAVVFSLS